MLQVCSSFPYPMQSLRERECVCESVDDDTMIVSESASLSPEPDVRCVLGSGTTADEPTS